MAVQLKHSVFVHIPKAGGRWARDALINTVDGARQLYDPIYDAHWAPDTGLPVITIIRDPVDWMESLFAQRARKGFNWHKQDIRQGHMGVYPPVELEIGCGCSDPLTFFKCIAERPGVVTNGYVMHWMRKYGDVRYVRMEYLVEDFPRVLTELGEVFDGPRLIKATGVPHKKATYIKQCPPDLARKIRENERDFFGQFYGAMPE